MNDAAARSTGMVNQDQQLAAEVCKAGARLANASPTDLAELQRAFAPVYSALEKNKQTKTFVARIKALKASTPSDPPLTIPAKCKPSASKSAAARDPLAGSWTTAKITESEFVRAFIAAGGSERDGHSFFSQLGDGATRFAKITMRFERGTFDAYESGDGRAPVQAGELPYSLEKNRTVTLKGGCAGDATYRYELHGDTLRLHVVNPQCGGPAPPDATALYASFPYQRSG